MIRLRRSKQQIPALGSSSVKPGGQSVVKRSYPTGRKNYLRLVQYDDYFIQIQFQESKSPPEKVLLYLNNLSNSQFKPVEVELKGGPLFFEGKVPTLQCGVSCFKIKYQQNKEWFWDSHPFSYFLVDPYHIRDRRIYTFIPTASGSMSEWKEKLIQIKEMGFNTIHFLPLTKMDKSESPYAAAHLFQIDPSYVDPKNRKEGLKQFEDFVHFAAKNGISLCIDLVLNSVGLNNEIVMNRPDWIVEDPSEPDGFKRAGWSDGKTWHQWGDLVLLDYEPFSIQSRDELWNHMTQYALFWSRFAALSGGMIRLDNLHSSHESFLHQLVFTLRSEFPELIIFAELFDSEEKIEKLTLLYGINLLLATPWEHKFLPELRRYLTYIHQKKNKLRYFFPISSHDSGSPAEEFGHVKATIPRLVISTLFGPGPSGITQGVEYGCQSSIEFIGKNKNLNVSCNENYVDLIKKLNNLTKKSPLFHVPGNLYFLDEGHQAILSAFREDPKTKRIVFFLFANLDIHHEQHTHISLAPIQERLASNKFVDVLEEKEIQINQNSLHIHLPPCGVQIISCHA